MEISIEKVKMVIDELQAAENSYQRQVSAFDKILHSYQTMDTDGNDKRTMQRISEDLDREYRSIKELRKTLMEVVRCYEAAEKNITSSSAGTFYNAPVFKKINLNEAKRILEKFNITIK